MLENRVAVEIGSLAGLDLHSLRERWRHLYGTVAPARMSRELIARAIAHRIQVEAEGDLSPALRRLLQAGTTPRRAANADYRVKAGTRFLRQWEGRTCEVTALPNGAFAFDGEEWRSLSAIARAITGTRWSGPAFFGLREGKSDVDE